ncbi:glycosyltransferase [Bifidobacterium pullorum subsp. saeculare DSM 6531 = LMG 14934]|uniref:Glycosyltransferase n=1 Tax=Bifidobacterium pullorum subsp. saeculare DSM 6531 = LMG 14934 TaxID=1437611 RepID=A0A087CQC8_9BIFI|nr:glycosyltransferase family 4 protein [Bifidobacterium pullorum]KFI85478.1 glycosyltransferase [Bifidobacterium pullorum subsp. saeculare DSM 6531 = LMG 14934]
MHKIYATISYIKQYGFLFTLKKVYDFFKRFIFRKTAVVGISEKKPIDVMVSTKDVIKADFVGDPYCKPHSIHKSQLRIGWVLSPISIGSGGQHTIARFARSLQERGHEVTFFIYESIAQQPADYAHELLKEHFDIDVQCRPIAEAENFDGDVMFATGWETAYPVFNMNIPAHKMYFVQDFEPLFYGTGSKSVLAENTYRFGFYGVTAGRWLTQKVAEYGMPADYFDFGADLDIYRPVDTMQKKQQVCFYARPVTERRAFEIGVLALARFHQEHPDYRIVFFGWDVSDYDIPFPYENRGIVNPTELAEIYHASQACLVLSLTNASLLPLELLAAGCVPVMNDGPNNRMVIGENPDIVYTINSPIELAKGLDSVVTDPQINERCRRISQMASSSSWDASYEKFEHIILREVTDTYDE